MNKKLIVKQNGIKDCAVACILSIIRYYKGEVSRSEIEYLIKTNEHGTSAYNMIEGVKSLGLQGIGKKVSINNIKDEKHNLPFIAHVKTYYGYHYVVVYELNEKNILLMDPALGKRKVTYSEFRNEFLNTILIFKKVKQLPILKEKNELLNYIISIIKINTSIVFKTILLTFIITILAILISLNMKVFIDYIIKYNKFNLIYLTLFIFISFIILKNILYYIRDKLMRKIDFDLNSKINYKIINHIIRLPYSYFKTRPSGEIINRINDLEYLKNFIYEILLNIFVDIFIILFSYIFLIILSFELTILISIFILIYMIISLIYMKLYDKYILESQISSSEYQSDLYDYISSYETIRNINKREFIIDLLDYKYYKSLIKINKFKKKMSNEIFIKNLITESCEILISFIGVILVINKMISLGDLISFITLYSFLNTPLRSLMDSLVSYVYSSNSYKRINDLLMIKEETLPTSNERIDGNIEFKNIDIIGNDKKLISNFNLLINKGDHVLLKGKSGCGKSTLLKLLRKYITDYKGNIYIDNINLKDIDSKVIENSILYVSQHEKLNTMSIKNNILYGRDISLKKYNLINKLTLTDKIIDKKEFRDECYLEEDGFNISGGERQKIILSRNLHEPFNILVIDEALSEVDIEDEKTIINNLFNYYKDKTIIYVSHKNEICNNFNKVITIGEEDGRRIN